MVNVLVENNEKTEPIWKNGEQSVIKTALKIKKYKVELIQDKFREKIKEINEKNI